MKPAANTQVRLTRCAIYTRKSSDEGLDQAFNSLHAQREACEAYIKSQAHEGWRALQTAYDDGGASGGTMDRPALQQLLADVDAGLIDTIVVYKIDRLTRSLTDFGRIVERLEVRNASFVSVTQSFNTTTSMGRLTLNVLLSFAQFEREVTGERIRDKIAASKRKGMWMGGRPPLGYDPPVDPATRALVVNEAEAETVRLIFRRYLELGTVPKLLDSLNAQGVTSKRWRTTSGEEQGGFAFSRGAMYHLLQNRTYLGEIPHGAETFPGAHPRIVPEELFVAVQSRLAAHLRGCRERPRRASSMPLKGLLFDLDGHPMSPSFAAGRNGRVYRYYVSAPLLQGFPCRLNEEAVRRVSAPALEEKLRIELARLWGAEPASHLRDQLVGIKRLELDRAGVRLVAAVNELAPSLRGLLRPLDEEAGLGEIHIAMSCCVRGGRTWVTSPEGDPQAVRRDPVLIRGLRQAHRLASAMGWRMGDGDLATPEVKAPPSAYDRKLCRLAFLAPDIQAAIMRGRQPQGLTLDSLLHSEIPIAWADQRSAFGFT